MSQHSSSPPSLQTRQNSIWWSSSSSGSPPTSSRISSPSELSSLASHWMPSFSCNKKPEIRLLPPPPPPQARTYSIVPLDVSQSQGHCHFYFYLGSKKLIPPPFSLGVPRGHSSQYSHNVGSSTCPRGPSPCLGPGTPYGRLGGRYHTG